MTEQLTLSCSRECNDLIITLTISLSRGLLPFLSYLKFLSLREAGLHFFPFPKKELNDKRGGGGME